MQNTWLVGFVALLVGCSGPEPGTAATSVSGAGGAGGTGGMGGMGGGSATGSGGDGGVFAGSGGNGGSGGSGGGFACPTPSFLEFEGDGAPKQLGAACDGTWGATFTDVPNGYKAYLGKGGTQHLVIEGCGAPTPEGFPKLRIEVDLFSEGMVTTGSAQYTPEGGGTSYSTLTDVKLTLTKYGPQGDAIEGTFTTIVAFDGGSDQTLTLTGKLSVCHVPDTPPPP